MPLMSPRCPNTNGPVSVQRCDIGDASRGSLSSYAYILMVLYFLQQRQPPVIPVLQEVPTVPTVASTRVLNRMGLRGGLYFSDLRWYDSPSADGGRLECLLL